MLTIRKEIFPEDIKRIEQILISTAFFDQAPDEIDVAIELANLSLKNGNTVDNYRFVFVCQDDVAVGFGCYAKVPCTLSSYEIYWLGVDKDCQGSGLGKMVVKEIISEIASLGGLKVVLQTAGREQYLPTHRFYNACNFIEEARIKDYYAKGDDCLFFTLSL